jgi:uncharacterized membrane protein YeaQ/YmgE (transglycosylase-associated protein family)
MSQTLADGQHLANRDAYDFPAGDSAITLGYARETGKVIIVAAASQPTRRHGQAATQDSKERTSMGFISWIVVGAIAGFLANLIMGSRQGLLMMVILGIVGGLVGGFVATSVLGVGSVNGINVQSIVIATLGAIAVVFVAGFVTRPRGLLRR